MFLSEAPCCAIRNRKPRLVCCAASYYDSGSATAKSVAAPCSPGVTHSGVMPVQRDVVAYHPCLARHTNSPHQVYSQDASWRNPAVCRCRLYTAEISGVRGSIFKEIEPGTLENRPLLCGATFATTSASKQRPASDAPGRRKITSTCEVAHACSSTPWRGWARRKLETTAVARTNSDHLLAVCSTKRLTSGLLAISARHILHT